MQTLGYVFQAIVNGMKIPINIYGFTFSFWDIFIWSIIAGIVGMIIGRILHG